MKHFIVKKLIYLSLLLHIQLLFPSVLADTLIKTSVGLVPVESVTHNTHLIGYSSDQSFVKIVVNNIGITTTQTIVVITTNKGAVYAHPDQLFYDIQNSSWVKAQDIIPQTKLLTYSDHCTCIATNILSVPPTNVYHISTTDPHTFFVSEQELLTHNVFPVVVINLAWLFGEGLTCSLSTILTGTLFGIKLYKEHNKAKPSITFIPGAEGFAATCNLSPDPDDDKHKKRKFNTMSKAEFFKKVGDDYEYWRDGIYKRKSQSKGLDKKTEYLKWDPLHNDVEAFSKAERHLGSYDPATLELYKGPVHGRKL